MVVSLLIWEKPVTTEAENGEFLVCILRPGWNGFTPALVAVMEMGLILTALNTATQIIAGVACHLVFSFPGLMLVDDPPVVCLLSS
jgi:hypothetical protein